MKLEFAEITKVVHNVYVITVNRFEGVKSPKKPEF